MTFAITDRGLVEFSLAIQDGGLSLQQLRDRFLRHARPLEEFTPTQASRQLDAILRAAVEHPHAEAQEVVNLALRRFQESEVRRE